MALQYACTQPSSESNRAYRNNRTVGWYLIKVFLKLSYIDIDCSRYMTRSLLSLIAHIQEEYIIFLFQFLIKT